MIGEFITITILNTEFLVSLDTGTVRQILSRNRAEQSAVTRIVKNGALTKRIIELAQEHEAKAPKLNGFKRKVG